MSDNTQRPRTGGKVDDRKNKSNRDTHTSNKGGKSDRFGKNQKGSQPKYDDTQEAKKQKEKIDRIDDEILKTQKEIERIGKVRVVVRKPRTRLTNKDQILKEIETTKTRVSRIEEQIKTMQPEVKRALEAVNDKRTAVNRLKTGVFIQNVSTTDFIQQNELKLREEVKRLEGKLETETLSIAEEKIVVQDIKKVKAMRANFEPYQKRATELRQVETTFNRLDRDLKTKTQSLEEYKTTILELQGDLNSLEEREKEAENLRKEEEKKQKETEQKEKDEKTKLTEKLDELVKQFRLEKDNLAQMRDKWYENKREERNKKLELANSERSEKRRLQEQELKDQKAQERHERRTAIPFNTEITVCQNLIVYLNELLNSTRVNEPTSQPVTTNEQKKEEKGDQGYIKGKTETEDLLFPESTGQQKKKKTQKKKKAVPTKITHNWDTFTRFEEIGLGEPPITASQIPKAIEDVKAKLVEFKKKSQEERLVILKKLSDEEREEKKQEEEKEKLRLQKEKEEKEAPKTTEEPKKEEGTQTNESK